LTFHSVGGQQLHAHQYTLFLLCHFIFTGIQWTCLNVNISFNSCCWNSSDLHSSDLTSVSEPQERTLGLISQKFVRIGREISVVFRMIKQGCVTPVSDKWLIGNQSHRTYVRTSRRSYEPR
jgi:hypothetical protein